VQDGNQPLDRRFLPIRFAVALKSFNIVYLLSPLCAVERIFSANLHDAEVPRLALTAACKRTKAAPKGGFRGCWIAG
jgi:hypothetical protein